MGIGTTYRLHHTAATNMDQHIFSSSNCGVIINKLRLSRGFWQRLTEPCNGSPPGGSCWVAVDENHDRNRAGPVGVEVVTCNQRRHKAHYGYGSGHQGELKSCSFQRFQQPANTGEADNVL